MGLDIKKLQEEKRLKEMSRQNKDENQLAALTKIMTAIKNCFEEILQSDTFQDGVQLGLLDTIRRDDLFVLKITLEYNEVAGIYLWVSDEDKKRFCIQEIFRPSSLSSIWNYADTAYTQTLSLFDDLCDIFENWVKSQKGLYILNRSSEDTDEFDAEDVEDVITVGKYVLAVE